MLCIQSFKSPKGKRTGPVSKANFMEITINQEKKDIEQGLTLEELMESLGYGKQEGIAVAVNDEVVPKGEWGRDKLKEADRVTIITATQGG